MASFFYKQKMPPELPRWEGLELTNLQQAQDEGRPSEARKGSEVKPEAGPRQPGPPDLAPDDPRRWTWNNHFLHMTSRGRIHASLETKAINLALLKHTRDDSQIAAFRNNLAAAARGQNCRI